MISININKPMLALAPCIVNIESRNDNGTVYAAVRKKTQLNIPQDDLYENYAFGMSWIETDGTSNYVSFMMKNSPSLENELPTWSSSGLRMDFQSYLRAIAAKMQQHPIAGIFFKMLSNGTGVSIEHGEAIRSLQLIVSYGPFSVTETAARASTEPPNYRVLYEVYASTHRKRLFSGIDTPDIASQLRLNISEIWKNYLVENTSIFPANSTIPVKTPFMRGIMRLTEEYGAIVNRKTWTWTDSFPIMYADALCSLPKLPMVVPDYRDCDENDPIFFAWTNTTNQTMTVGIECRCTSRDNVTSVMSPRLSTVEPYHSLYVPVFSFHTAPNPLMLKLRLINEQSIAISEWRTYYPNDSLETRHLMFLNHFGVWETMRFTGELGSSSDLRKLDASSFKDDGIETVSTQNKWNRLFTYRSGWISKGESFALEHLISSPLVYEVHKLWGYVRLNLQDKKFTPDEGSKDIYSAEIKAIPVRDKTSPTQDFWTKWQ
jgi:hypothetical protein